MPVDPKEVVRTARDNGEPELAEWLQREAEAFVHEKRMGRLKVALWLIAFWAVLGFVAAGFYRGQF